MLFTLDGTSWGCSERGTARTEARRRPPARPVAPAAREEVWLSACMAGMTNGVRGAHASFGLEAQSRWGDGAAWAAMRPAGRMSVATPSCRLMCTDRLSLK